MTRIDPDEEARKTADKWYAIVPLDTMEAEKAALQAAISSTITRYAEALEVASQIFDNMRQFSCRADSENAASALKTIDSILSRSDAPEMEEVELTSWAIIAPSGYIETTSVNKDLQRSQVANENSPFYGYQVVKLTGTIQRPKSKPVVKSISIDAEISFNGFIVEGKGGLFSDFPEIKGKKVKLTAAYTEPPK